MRKNIIFFLIFFYSESWSQSFSERMHMNFDDGWKFSFGNTSDPKKDFNYGIANIFNKSGSAGGTAIDPYFNDSTWQTIDLPHDWAVELPFVKSDDYWVMSHGYKPVGGLFPKTSIGWYRKHFSVASSDSGKRFQIQFDGIFRDASIWVNGFYVGNNKSGYVGISYDVTDYINFNKPNVIVVRVDATQYEGWFYEGAGIYRHVWLNSYNNLHISDNGVYATNEIEKDNAIIHMATGLENIDAKIKKASVRSYLLNHEGNVVAKTNEQYINIRGIEQITTHQQMVVQRPNLWSTEDPYLYRLVTEVKYDKKVIDRKTIRFGIRSINITKEGVFVNNKYVKIYGTNNHQDHAGVGSALPDYLQYYRIRLLKDMGVNAYRTSHNAPTPELLDACDSLGMLVLDEQRLLNSSPEYIDQFERLIKRDRNRPSVFLWSIGNEEGWIQTTSTGSRIAQSLILKQKDLDPSRTCTYAADVGNIFEGVNSIIPVRGFNYRESEVEAYHKDHPQQPIVGTEMGSTVTTRGIYTIDTLHGYVPDEDSIAPSWASRAETWWKLCAPKKWWMGGFVWTGFDYRGEPTPYEWPDINSNFGLMDVCGFPKNIYYYYQSWWRNIDVLHLSPHWNWKGKEGQPVNVWVNSNAENVELFVNGKSQGKKQMPVNGHLEWSVPYEPGILSAVANKKGKILTEEIETTDQPSEVVVTPSKTTIIADGKDAVIINISAIDSKGHEVPDANNLIHFSIKGDARIIGTGNGDPSSHEADKLLNKEWQRHLFNGKCQVIIQAGKNSSIIQFEATAEGLYKGSTTINSIHIYPSTIIVEKESPRHSMNVSRMVGADISFLPELEAKGIHFSDKGIQKDPLQILKEHGFNYIRLRVFNNPSTDSGYSPKKGFCDLAHTLIMAKRIKEAGMKLLLDFHYSDYWADPQQQYKPSSWKHCSFNDLKDSMYVFTRNTLMALKAQGTEPEMVQIGNEINHGILWPEGNIGHIDSLALLLRTGIKAVKEYDPSIIVMIHIALGGQNDESRFFLDKMIERGVHFDIIGLSYYPKWHGTTDDLRNNMTDLINHYHKDVVVVEYSQLKRKVNDIVFNLPENKGKGTFIWEPLSTWESIFDKDGKSNKYIDIYNSISSEYLHGGNGH